MALLLPGTRFPQGSFPLRYDSTLVDQPADEFQGFFDIKEADKLITDTNLSVDRYALALLSNSHKEFQADGVQSFLFSPRFLLSSVPGIIGRSLLLRPSFCGMGIDLKELFKQ